MKLRLTSASNQKGSMMIEALAAILIFSLGILAMMGLQATSIKLSGDAKYRTDASMLANQLIGQMWVSDRTPATLQAAYQGGGANNGAAYTAWLTNVTNALPGVAGVAANQPIVTVVPQVPVAPATSVTNIVTITIFWKAPNESAASGKLCGITNTSAAHCYITLTQII
jgi:type IV pilus assembly protein PilV